MKTIFVSVCVSVHPNKARQTIQNRAVEATFHVFRYNFACRPSILISKKLAEFSENADSESISFFWIFASKASKAVKTTFGPVCMCERQPFLPVLQSLEKKFGLLK